MPSSDFDTINSFLDALIYNHPLPAGELHGPMQEIQEKFRKLYGMLQELKEFALRLSAGDIEAPTPKRENYIAAGLKQLQAQMIHLTWQAQQVADGGYQQQVDFMGDFSKAFNGMVHQLERRETALKEQQDVMEKVFNLVEPIIVVNKKDPREIFYANEMALYRFGVRKGIFDFRSPTLLEILSLQPGNTEQQIFDMETAQWYSVSVHPLLWASENNAILYYCRDITLHKKRESDLDTAANTDELTGINNRRAFEHTYAQLWDMCMKTGRPLSLIMFDLDHFKRFNDTFGHLEGDKMLSSFAGVLQHSIVRKDDILARYGGEEFIVALPFTEKDSAIAIAQAVCDRTRQHTVLINDNGYGEKPAHISVSAGVSSIIPSEAIQSANLVRTADAALYDAKMAGRDRVCYRDICNLRQDADQIAR